MSGDSIWAFGVELRPLGNADLPLLRHWRNQPEILPFMDPPKPVSIAHLAFWLAKIRKYQTAIPWLAYYNGAPVAYAEIKEINQGEKSCVGGLFLFGEKYYGTGLGYRIILCREVAMRRLGLEILYSHIHRENRRSMDFCRQYGAELIGRANNINIYKYPPEKKCARLKFIAKALKLSREYDSLLGGKHPCN